MSANVRITASAAAQAKKHHKRAAFSRRSITGSATESHGCQERIDLFEALYLQIVLHVDGSNT